MRIMPIVDICLCTRYMPGFSLHMSRVAHAKFPASTSFSLHLMLFPEKQLAGRSRQQGGESEQLGGGGGQQDSGGGGGGNNQQQENTSTWVHEIFQAVVTRELKCLNCEAVSTLVVAVIFIYLT